LNNEPSNETNNAPLVLEDFNDEDFNDEDFNDEYLNDKDFNLTKRDFRAGKLLKRKTKKSHYKRKRTNKRNQK